MKNKYKLTIEFESEKPLKDVANYKIQFENGLTYFVDGNINQSFVYGTGKSKLNKIKERAKK